MRVSLSVLRRKSVPLSLRPGCSRKVSCRSGCAVVAEFGIGLSGADLSRRTSHSFLVHVKPRRGVPGKNNHRHHEKRRGNRPYRVLYPRITAGLPAAGLLAATMWLHLCIEPPKGGNARNSQSYTDRPRRPALFRLQRPGNALGPPASLCCSGRGVRAPRPSGTVPKFR
jgi:hypothetical protein